jgi:hypothetical protein
MKKMHTLMHFVDVVHAFLPARRSRRRRCATTTRGQPPAHLWSCVHLRGCPPPFLRPSPLITHTLRASRGPAFRRRHFEGMGERVPTERGWPSQAMSSPPPFHRSVPFLIPCANQLQFDSWSRCSLVADSVSNQGSWYYLFVC